MGFRTKKSFGGRTAVHLVAVRTVRLRDFLEDLLLRVWLAGGLIWLFERSNQFSALLLSPELSFGFDGFDDSMESFESLLDGGLA